jgi:exopolysaccharide biosynthesis polyprenyl glycosylphosphotransferase
LACLIRSSTLPFEITVHNVFFDVDNSFRPVFLLFILGTIFLNNAHGLYQTKREIVETIEVWQVIKSVFFASLITIVAIYITKIEDFPRTIFSLIVIFTTMSFSLWRIGKRLLVEYLISRGYNNFNVLIVGAGKVGHALVGEMKKRPSLGLQVVGFLDDFKTQPDHPSDPKVLGKLSDFAKVARREFINEVYITVHSEVDIFAQIMEQAKKMGIAVKVIPQGFEMIARDFNKYNIGFIPVLEYLGAQDQQKQVGKRLFDICVSASLIVFLLPVFLTIVILIKLDSPGPVLYFSKRFGRSGRVFHMYKFRSMVMDAERLLEKYKHKNEVDGPIFKIKNDPRITRIGRILRKYSLDELPQLFNVLEGTMSLVGPRPLPINQVEKEDLKQLRRLEIRPGITGLWQIRGRSDISFSRLVKWDMWYISNWSFWLDLNILWQTFPVVIKGRGAY